MKANFTTALKLVLVHEGGWAKHPRDPGGATMKGVTLRTFQRHFGTDRTEDELSNITAAQLETIYRSGYWEPCRCDDLPAGLDYAVFDAAVNSGPGRSAKWLQAAVGAKQDGAIGPKTLARVAQSDTLATVIGICHRRLVFLQSLDTWTDFGKGWGRRVEEVRTEAIRMAGGQPAAAADFSPSVDYRTVKRGSNGVWVEKLQAALGLHVNGNFNAGTEAALKAYQAANGLEVDGIAGRVTYRSLGLLA